MRNQGKDKAIWKFLTIYLLVVECNTEKRGDIFMRSVVSVSLPKDMASKLKKAAKEIGKSQSEIIKDSLRAYLWETRFMKLRKAMVEKAEGKGILTDEDVFKAVS